MLYVSFPLLLLFCGSVVVGGCDNAAAVVVTVYVCVVISTRVHGTLHMCVFAVIVCSFIVVVVYAGIVYYDGVYACIVFVVNIVIILRVLQFTMLGFLCYY